MTGSFSFMKKAIESSFIPSVSEGQTDSAEYVIRFAPGKAMQQYPLVGVPDTQ